MAIKIRRRRDIQGEYHYAVFVNSEWVCDCDTYEEAAREAEAHIAELAA